MHLNITVFAVCIDIKIVERKITMTTTYSVFADIG